MEINMIEDVIVEPMTEEFIVWCCLHGGPLSCKELRNYESQILGGEYIIIASA